MQSRGLVRGVSSHIKEIDKTIESVSAHWRGERMAVVDRNILRLGVFELFHCDDIPMTVTINEMVELAKQFGSDTSSAFINGILDKISTQVDNPDKAP